MWKETKTAWTFVEDGGGGMRGLQERWNWLEQEVNDTS